MFQLIEHISQLQIAITNANNNSCNHETEVDSYLNNVAVALRREMNNSFWNTLNVNGSIYVPNRAGYIEQSLRASMDVYNALKVIFKGQQQPTFLDENGESISMVAFGTCTEHTRKRHIVAILCSPTEPHPT